ncbi:hypothetical protein BGZ70_007135 [Mortierella alpina]|uniref:FHA domain-containing protein n=1 Tax=Mortierella alpina TaxID=64518 RepID=A0A9P6JG79_MORAP|nr:hypothetical protein BGZ70_007135 [Mortierella alpina]
MELMKENLPAPHDALHGSYDTPVIVGRGSQATLNLGRVNKQVSRRHAIVQWCSESAAFQIVVLGQNGVRINGTGFPSGQQATLRGGDIVDLVGVKMIFRAPAGPPPAAENESDLGDDLDSSFVAAGLVTPKKANAGYQHHQLATPTRSSPIRADHLSSPSPLTPTARMRHKMQKYDQSPVNRNMFHSPPPSSDGATEFGTSPVPYRSEFTFSVEASPVRKPNLSGFASPKSEPNIFMDELPPKNPFKALTQQHQQHQQQQQQQHQQQRVPLAPLALNENNRSSQESRQQASTNRAPLSAPTSPLMAKSNNMKQLTPASSVKSTSVAAQNPHPKQSKTLAGKAEDAENRAPAALKEEKSSASKDAKGTTQDLTKSKDLSKSVLATKSKALTDSTNKSKDSIHKAKDSANKVKDATNKEKDATSKEKDATNKDKDATRKVKDSTIKVKDSLDKAKDSARPHSSAQDTATRAEKAKQPLQVPASKEQKDTATLAKKNAESAPHPDHDDHNEASSSSSSRESSPEAPVKKAPMDYTEMIIDTLVFARKKKSMTLTELFDEMIMSQPSLMAAHDADEIKAQMLQSLSAARCVGKITRKGKDAYNKPLENQWYYIPECDHNVMRKLTRQEVMPSARKCTLKDKQYFFKMPPKLPYHRKSASPYAVKPTPRRGKDSSKLSVPDDNGDVSSSSSDQEDDDGTTIGGLSSSQTPRKRKSTSGSGLVDTRKRKGALISTAAVATTPTSSKSQAGEDDEDDDEDAQHDSLDDLSELSGLSD